MRVNAGEEYDQRSRQVSLGLDKIVSDYSVAGYKYLTDHSTIRNDHNMMTAPLPA